MIFVKNSRGGREVNMINNMSKKIVKNKVGGREVHFNLDNVNKCTGFFYVTPKTGIMKLIFFNLHSFFKSFLLCSDLLANLAKSLHLSRTSVIFILRISRSHISLTAKDWCELHTCIPEYYQC